MFWSPFRQPLDVDRRGTKRVVRPRMIRRAGPRRSVAFAGHTKAFALAAVLGLALFAAANPSRARAETLALNPSAVADCPGCGAVFGGAPVVRFIGEIASGQGGGAGGGFGP